MHIPKSWTALNECSQCTVLGLCAPLLFAMSVGLVRRVTETMGLTAGIALMSGTAALFLFKLFGFPDLRCFSRSYLVFGIGSAVLCEISFATSLGLSNGGQQTIEVGMINYLWPCLTVLSSVYFNNKKAKWWLWIGVLVSLIGICIVLSGDRGFSPSEIVVHMRDNPLSYFLALVSAISWTVYCTLTSKSNHGQNPTVLIFSTNASFFAIAYFLGFGPRISWNISAFADVFLTSAIMGAAYALWTRGAMKGNLTVLGIASYFTPVLSCVFASIWLHAPLSMSFYQGVLLVVLGSLLCWLSTRQPSSSRSPAS